MKLSPLENHMAVSIHEGDGSVPDQSFARRDFPPLRHRGVSPSLSRGHDVLERAEVAPGGGRPSRIMRVERVKGATWEEAMPPLAPSDRSPTATPELNCSTICLSKCHHELNFSCPLSPPRTTFKSRFDKRIKWFVPWIELYIKTIIISLSSSDDEKYFSNV